MKEPHELHESNSMPQMSFSLSRVDVSGVEHIVRHVQIPAMRTTPLYQTMFPLGDTATEQQKNTIIRWYSEMLRQALEDHAVEDPWNNFLKASTSDGTPVGFCSWETEQKKHERIGERRMGTWVPNTLDVLRWTRLSKALQLERKWVLQDHDDICWVTYIVVDPRYQRQGIGSSMLQRICGKTDQHGRCAWAIASPEGVRLYEKFGFETVGHVETPRGLCTSMLRPPQKP